MINNELRLSQEWKVGQVDDFFEGFVEIQNEEMQINYPCAKNITGETTTHVFSFCPVVGGNIRIVLDFSNSEMGHDGFITVQENGVVVAQSNYSSVRCPIKPFGRYEVFVKTGKNNVLTRISLRGNLFRNVENLFVGEVVE